MSKSACACARARMRVCVRARACVFHGFELLTYVQFSSSLCVNV